VPAVFPYLGSWGSTDSTDYRSILREYDDGSEREYRKSSFKFRTITLSLSQLTKTRRDTVESFFNTNRFIDIYVYVWPEASSVDLSGASSTGRHTARIRSSLDFTNESSCRYSTKLTFKLKD
jgi:hypothetical protein